MFCHYQTAIHYHHMEPKLIVPTNAKRVGSSASKIKGDNSTFTLMLAAELFSNFLMPPFIIFKAVFGAKLMEKWLKHVPSRVVFTENHFMNAFTFCLWVQ